MFDDVLIESAGKDRKKGGWVTALISAILHVAIIGGVVAAGLYVKQKPEVIVKPIVATKRVDPQYTEVARKARIEGMVILEAIIDKEGNVTDVRVLKGLPMGLDQAALDAVKRWKFTPGTLNGQPVPVIFNLTV